MKETPEMSQITNLEEINWMVCSQCRITALYNDTNVCLACHHLYDPPQQPDSYEAVKRTAEQNNALQVASAEKVDVRKQTEDG